MSAPLAVIEDQAATDDDELWHIYCCDRATAICGSPIDPADCADDADGDVACVVCADLEVADDWRCPYCEASA